MCLVLFAHSVRRDFPLVVAANRDEFYARPTVPAAFWADATHVLAGRDLRGGGTWMGVTRRGRWAALTNYRDPPTAGQDRPSRGMLVAEFLTGNADPQQYLADLAPDAQRYDGFNLLVGDPGSVYYLGNRMPDPVEPQRLEPGVYGLSNHLLDTPWPKVARGRQRLEQLLHAGATPTPEALLEILYDTEIAPLQAAAGRPALDAELERALSAAFVVTPTYGTRSSTALVIDDAARVTFVERAFRPGPVPDGDARSDFQLRPA